jgi:hypothetical protein
LQPYIIPGYELPLQGEYGMDPQLEKALQTYGYVVPNMMPNVTGNVMPRPTTAVLPTMTGTARAALVTSNETPVKPLDLVRELPSIVSTEPVDLTPPCPSFSMWVSEHPCAAGLLLVGAAVLLWGRK